MGELCGIVGVSDLQRTDGRPVRCSVLAGGLAVLLAPGCTPPAETGELTDRSEARLSEVARPFRHPLLSARERGRGDGLPNGALPFFDVKNSPAGDRYAIHEGIDVDEAGVVRSHSGVSTLRREGGEAAAKRTDPMVKEPRVAAQAPPTRLGRSLQTRLEQVSSNEPTHVEITIKRTSAPLTQLMQRAIAEGQISDRPSQEAWRASAIAQKQIAVQTAQDPVVARVRNLGGTVVARYENLHAVAATLPAGRVAELLLEPTVRRVDLVEPGRPMSPDGIAVRTGQQLDQFIDDGFNGERGGSSDVSFAHIEGGEDDGSAGIDANLHAYKEDTSGTRIRELYTCGSSCTTTTSYPNPSWHMTKVASILFSDLQDGQDPNYTTSDDRKARSGFATEAKGYFYTMGSFGAAVNHVIGISTYEPAVMNFSFGYGQLCTGEDSASVKVDELYEAGTLTFVSAGNDGHSSATDCQIRDPGSAAAAFTVASYGDTASSTVQDVREDEICSSSSRGGTASEGKGRTIVDLAAYAPRTRIARPGNVYSSGGCATSYAAPAAAGAAIAFADHYYMTYGSLIFDPGMLHVAMLLMGDRTNEGGGTQANKFNNVYGSGRMRMRRLDATGMDSPTGFAVGYTCIDHGEWYHLPLNGGNALSSDVDIIKAVTWWYDPRLEDGTDIDDIDLRLDRNGTAVQYSSSGDDEKERVKHSTDGTSATFELVFHGENVTYDGDGGCGTNSKLIYYAYFYEDSDRDDGPELAEILPE